MKFGSTIDRIGLILSFLFIFGAPIAIALTLFTIYKNINNLESDEFKNKYDALIDG